MTKPVQPSFDLPPGPVDLLKRRRLMVVSIVMNLPRRDYTRPLSLIEQRRLDMERALLLEGRRRWPLPETGSALLPANTLPAWMRRRIAAK